MTNFFVPFPGLFTEFDQKVELVEGKIVEIGYTNYVYLDQQKGAGS